MNKQRRREISKVMQALDEIHTSISDIWGEEEESYDNLPDSIRYSERGDAHENAIDALQSAMGSIEEASDYLEAAQEQ